METIGILPSALKQFRKKGTLGPECILFALHGPSGLVGGFRFQMGVRASLGFRGLGF